MGVCKQKAKCAIFRPIIETVFLGRWPNCRPKWNNKTWKLILWGLADEVYWVVRGQSRVTDMLACQTNGVPKYESSSVSSFSLLFACWSVEANQSAQLSAMHRPPIIPPWWEADCRKGRTLEWLCQGSSRMLTVVWVEGSRGAFHQKPHMEAISEAVRTGTFPFPPPHSLDFNFGM